MAPKFFLLLAPAVAALTQPALRLTPSPMRAHHHRAQLPRSTFAAKPRGCARPAGSSSGAAAPPRMMATDFSSMKRADEPLDEEVNGLRLALGAFGVFFGPLLVGSSLIGLVLGLAAATFLIDADGATGLWAREIGAQVWAVIARLKAEADTRNLPDVLRAARARAAKLGAAAAHEWQSLDQAAKLSTRSAALWAKMWTPVRARLDESGLAARLAAWWAASGIPAWIATCEANIERRRRQTP